MRKLITTHQLGEFRDLVKVELFEVISADGDRYKKGIRSYENEKKVKEELFEVISADGDRYKKGIEIYKNGKMVKSKLYDYFLKSENKTYKVIDYVKSEEDGRREYYYQGKLLKTRSL